MKSEAPDQGGGTGSSVNNDSPFKGKTDTELNKSLQEIEENFKPWNCEFETNGTVEDLISQKFDIDKTPTVLSPKEFEKMVSENNLTRVYRGISDWETPEGDFLASANEVANGFKNDDKYAYGGGNFGSGYHFFSDTNLHKGRAYNDARGFAHGGEVISGAVKPNAKIMDYDELKSKANKAGGIFEDNPTLYAVTHGIDGSMDKTGVMNIYNRGALYVSE